MTPMFRYIVYNYARFLEPDSRTCTMQLESFDPIFSFNVEIWPLYFLLV